MKELREHWKEVTTTGDTELGLEKKKGGVKKQRKEHLRK